MRAGFRFAWIWIAMLLASLGMAVATTAAVFRDTIDAVGAIPIVHVSPAGRTDAGWVRACGVVARCRGMVLGALHGSIRAHGPLLRVTYGLLVVWTICAFLFWGRMPRAHSAVGSARYAFPGELRRLRVQSGEAWLPLGYLPPSRFVRSLLHFAAGGRAFRTLVGSQVHLPAEDLARHVLVVGLTGAHKTTAVTLPILLEAARHGISVVAFDLKYGEADSLARAAREWQRWTRDVLIFAPLERATLRWNPLDRCRTIGDAYQLAAQLFDDPDPSDPDSVYWLGAERHVCAVLCYALATDGGLATLGRLRSLCESGPAGVHAYLRVHGATSTLTPRLGAYQAMLPKDQAGILQGIASRLEAWGDEVVCAATGPSAPWERIDLSRIRREPQLLLVGVPQAALGRLRWLCHLFLRNLTTYLLRPRGPDEPVRVLLVLEELPAWGAFPGLADHLATYRSRQVSVVATVQSEAQGEHVYGRTGWAAVAANLVTKLYLPSLADPDAERLSRVLGTAAGEDIARSRGWGPTGTRKGEHRRAIPMPLERPEALRGTWSSPEEILVRFARIAPARLWCPPYYDRPEYADRVSVAEIKTVDLAVYHHLREVRARSGARTAGPAVAVPMPEPDPRSITPTPTPRTEPDPSQNDGGPGSPGGSMVARVDIPPGDDVAALHGLIEALISPSQQDAGRMMNIVRSGGRIVGLRVRPEAVTQFCRGAESMHILARRWSALRWVRRVRPMFVLSRRALGVLDPDLLRKLDEACGSLPSSGFGYPRGRRRGAEISPAGGVHCLGLKR